MHPIAGRCKHCKADIAASRSSRPAAMAALPSLAAGGMPPLVIDPPAAILGNGDTSGPVQSAYAPNLAATIVSPSPVIAIANPYHDESRPILPPRPTGRMQTEPTRSMWRNWPVIVIVLAVLAIAAAVVLMLWPPAGEAKADGKKLAPPPAPERMDTNPMPPRDPGAGVTPSGPSDPWSNRGGVTPPPDDPDDIDPPDVLADPFANPGGGNPGLQPFGTNPFAGAAGGGALVFAMITRACDRMKQCPGSGVADMCSALQTSLGAFPMPPPPASCVAAQRCLSQIDKLDLCGSTTSSPLGGGLADVTMLLSTAQDCIDAARC